MRQIIALGNDQYHQPKRNIPRQHVRHFVDGFNGREFTGRRKYVTFEDPLGGLGGTRQVEVETGASAYYGRGQSLRHSFDKGQESLISGEWVRAERLDFYVVNPELDREAA